MKLLRSSVVNILVFFRHAGLGFPFNIASYALLTFMISHITHLKPGELVIVMGDTHVYLNHVEPLKEQLERDPQYFPTLKILRQVTDIDSFTADDLQLIVDSPHEKILINKVI